MHQLLDKFSGILSLFDVLKKECREHCAKPLGGRTKKISWNDYMCIIIRNYYVLKNIT